MAGTLNTAMYGCRSLRRWTSQEQIGNFRKWPTSTPEESNRRAIYMLVKRSFRFPTLGAFDLPDNISSCGQRDITTVPNQALTMLNNRTMQEQAEAICGALDERSGSILGDRPAGVEICVRPQHYRTNEREQVVEFIALARRSRAKALKVGGAELCLALFNTNEFTTCRRKQQATI